jgi:hypothetical protein
VLSAKLTAGLLAGSPSASSSGAAARDRLADPLRPRNIPSRFSGGDIALLAFGGLAASRCGAPSAPGSARSSATRSAAVITLLAWGFVVNNLLFGLAPSVGRFMPTRPRTRSWA